METNKVAAFEEARAMWNLTAFAMERWAACERKARTSKTPRERRIAASNARNWKRTAEVYKLEAMEADATAWTIQLP